MGGFTSRLSRRKIGIRNVQAFQDIRLLRLVFEGDDLLYGVLSATVLEFVKEMIRTFYTNFSLFGPDSDDLFALFPVG